MLTWKHILPAYLPLLYFTSMLAMRYLITFYSLSDIYILPLLFLYSILSTCFPCSLYQRGWDCTAWSVSPCVGVSL